MWRTHHAGDRARPARDSRTPDVPVQRTRDEYARWRCLVLGGAQVVAALTGMNVYAATFLIPAVVAAYVIAGGLRSTIIAYMHSVILFVAILGFWFLIAVRSELIGSHGRVYDLLQEASREMPIARNTDGSCLAFRSVGGLVFAIDVFVSGFTTVWLDQAYWQRAIASRPETSVTAYFLDGIAWHPIWLCNSHGSRVTTGHILLWGRMSTVAAVVAPWPGFACSVSAMKRSGAINVEATGDGTNAVAGNLASFDVGIVSAVVLSYLFPKRYPCVDAQVAPGIEGVTPTPQEDAVQPSKALDGYEKGTPAPAKNEIVEFVHDKQIEPMNPILVHKAERLAQGASIAVILIAVILVPFTLFGTSYVYSKPFFTGRVVVSLIWIWASANICVVYTVVESAGALGDISRGLWMDMKALMGVNEKLADQCRLIISS
ncbi:hypothetical protein CNMCM8927_000976 [Aspergillus lentulus]|uniref:Uncharacterized protein n=1 Tax=Aspergillus lentulus TaxID=293939 RepID=A0AAN5YJH5_ASPLE|nr:hypothetical protein CNMCM8927_000976 [Aspergillus lentulus]